MRNFFALPANGSYFEFFYNLAFLAGLVILIYEGFRRNYPTTRWIMMIAISWLMFIAGSKIFIYSGEDWGYVFRNLSLPPTSGKSLLGGLIAAGIGLFAGKYLFRFRQNFLDAYAFAIPLAVAIQRTGCFLTGCCFGKTTLLPWAVQYPVNSLPHFHHFQQNLISNHDFLSLPVHPVQLYEAAGDLFILFLLFRLRKYLKASGSLFMLSLILFCAVHFIIEFFRDPLAHSSPMKATGLFNQIQWFIVLIVFLISLVLLWRELTYKRNAKPALQPDLNLFYSFFILTLFCMFFWWLRNWLTRTETISFLICMFPVIAIVSYRAFRNYYRSPYRWLYFTGLTIPPLFMAQTFPINRKDSVFVKTYKSVSIGFANGKYQNSQAYGTGEGCDRITNREYFDQKYTLMGAGFSITRENPETNEQLTYGLNTFIGQHEEIRLSNQHQEKNFLLGVTPFINYDSKWVGVGGGLHVGKLSFTTENLDKEGISTPETGTIKTPVYPQLYFRVGPQRIFFVDYHLADHFPSALPGFRQQLGFGTGFGIDNGIKVRFGTTLMNFGDFFGSMAVDYYLEGYFPFNNKYVLIPMIIWGNSPKSDGKNMLQVSLGMSYRFNFQEGMKKRITKQMMEPE